MDLIALLGSAGFTHIVYSDACPETCWREQAVAEIPEYPDYYVHIERIISNHVTVTLGEFCTGSDVRAWHCHQRNLLFTLACTRAIAPIFSSSDKG